eukprot:CAMPEP_0181516834 /NCGR_PEP_ID=MMETSP1110-20121109/64369_1 /TAXON_ID=174948 /ORGANISM="Symbiodinium sp., Strain CCMP421" /LENGTH=397 /DNA_ID=CAMNT_0023647045 /DNA_START=56 /DNA_END=1249 /DNA_ORIENTATION=+
MTDFNESKLDICVKNSFLHFSIAETGVRRSYSCPPSLSKAIDTGPRTKCNDTIGTIVTCIDDEDDVSSELSQDTASWASESEYNRTCQTQNAYSGASSFQPCQPHMQEHTGMHPVATAQLQHEKVQEMSQKGGSLANEKQINKELMNVAKNQDNLKLLAVAARHLENLSGVNLATAFHRLARCTAADASMAEHSTVSAMLDRSEILARRESQHRDGSMPANCCTLIAWSCASLGVFRRSLFSDLARIALQSLDQCQTYEITNMLWSFAQLHKLRPDLMAHLKGELRDLVASVMRVFMNYGIASLKVQVLISALVSVATLPHSGAAENWLFSNISEELAARWSQLPAHNGSQIAVAFQLMRCKNHPLFQKISKSLARTSPDMASQVCRANRARTRKRV